MDVNKFVETAKSIDIAIRDNSTIKSSFIEVSSMLGDSTEESRKSIQEFLDTPLADKKELILKKAFAAAIIVAKEQGISPDFPTNGASIAAVIDDSLTRAKAGYLVEKGCLEAEEAIDNIIDHAESRAIAFVDKVFNSGMVSEFVTNGIVKLSKLVPYIGPVICPVVEHNKPVIKSFLKKAEPQIREHCKNGIKKVTVASKKIARTFVEKVKEKVKEKGKNFLNKILS